MPLAGSLDHNSNVGRAIGCALSGAVTRMARFCRKFGGVVDEQNMPSDLPLDWGAVEWFDLTMKPTGEGLPKALYQSVIPTIVVSCRGRWGHCDLDD
jgi:hypothetical protein